MCLAATLFVPGLVALFDQVDQDIPLGFRHRTSNRDLLLAQEAVVIDLHRVDLTLGAEIVRLDIFVSHDAAGDGGNRTVPGLPVKDSSAFRASDHVRSSFSSVMLSSGMAG